VELALMKMAHVSHILRPEELTKTNGTAQSAPSEQEALKKKLI
jgi:hypothetical protein